MTVFRRSAFALILAGSLGAAPALTPEPPLHLDALGTVRYALFHAPAIVAQEATVAQLAANFTKTRAGEYPSLTGLLQSQLSKSSNALGSFAQFGVQPVGNFSQNTAQLGGTYNIYNGTVQLTAQEQRRQLDAAKQNLRQQQEQTTDSVSQSFYNLAALHETVIVDEGDQRFQQALLDAARASEGESSVAEGIRRPGGEVRPHNGCARPMLVRLRDEDKLLLDARAEARGMRPATYASVLLRSHLRQLTPYPRTNSWRSSAASRCSRRSAGT